MTTETLTTAAALTGTPKQIKWAEDIRDRYITDLERLINNYSDVPESAASFAADQQFLSRQTSAKWFIEIRNLTTTELCSNINRIHRGMRFVHLDQWITWGFQP